MTSNIWYINHSEVNLPKRREYVWAFNWKNITNENSLKQRKLVRTKKVNIESINWIATVMSFPIMIICPSKNTPLPHQNHYGQITMKALMSKLPCHLIQILKQQTNLFFHWKVMIIIRWYLYIISFNISLMAHFQLNI